jgi:hypothetical protein
MTSTPNNARVQGMDGAPQASIFRRPTFAAMLLLLLATPLLLLLVAGSTGSALHDIVEQLSVIWLPLWAVFAVWVALDASAFIRFRWTSPRSVGSQGTQVVRPRRCKHRLDVPLFDSDKRQIGMVEREGKHNHQHVGVPSRRWRSDSALALHKRRSGACG